MGSCVCKGLCQVDTNADGTPTPGAMHRRGLPGGRHSSLDSSLASIASRSCLPSTLPTLTLGRSALRLLAGGAGGGGGGKWPDVDRLVLNTLKEIRTLLDNEQEPPRSMLMLHQIADKQKGWLSVIQSIVRVIPLGEPLGPAVVLLLLEDWSLPTTHAIRRLAESIVQVERTHDRRLARSECTCQKPTAPAAPGRTPPCEHVVGCQQHRNACIVLACLAEKLAGRNSIVLLTDQILDYLLAGLDTGVDGNITLFSLIALEKFAQTSKW